MESAHEQVAEEDLSWKSGSRSELQRVSDSPWLFSSLVPLLQLCESLVSSVIHAQIIIHIELMNEPLRNDVVGDGNEHLKRGQTFLALWQLDFFSPLLATYSHVALGH